MFEEWFNFITPRLPELYLHTAEHISLAAISTFLAICIGVPAAYIAFRYPRIEKLITGVASIVQTIPSLAMLAILLVLVQKIGIIPALISLVLYALLPIVRNTLTALKEVDERIMEAAKGIGMTEFQQLFKARLPLAMPTIIAGVRTAAVYSVGIATLAAFIGAGGLGQFINRGLMLVDTKLILLGAVPAALLAIIIDTSIALIEKSLNYHHKDSLLFKQRKVFLIFMSVFLFLILVVLPMSYSSDSGKVIKIGSKRASEQLILGEMMAQLIEAKTDIKVLRKLDLGGTIICHNALINKEIDIYPEYTGTGLVVILNQKGVPEREESFTRVAKTYEKKFQIKWLKPFPFNNNYEVLTTQDDSQKYNLENISDIRKYAHTMKAGFNPEFAERDDGYPMFERSYGLDFAETYDVDQALLFEALKKGTVNIIFADATDGRIPANNLKRLKDDKGLFPAYYPAPVIRMETLKRYPELENILAQLSPKVTLDVISQLNYRADFLQESAYDLAHEFLLENGLI